MLQLPATHWQNTIFTKCFINLEDPRRTTKGNFKHLLTDVLFLTVSAVLCGAGDWEAVELFGNNQLDWLKNTVLLQAEFLQVIQSIEFSHPLTQKPLMLVL